MEAENVKWQWNETRLNNIVLYKGFQFIYTYSENSNTGEINKVDSTGKIIKVWESREIFTDSAFLLIEDEILFIGLFSGNSTGCTVIALDLTLSQTIWERQLTGLGSVGHSRYNNKVQMLLIDNKLTVFGWESGGKYIEVLNKENGDLILNRKI